MMDDLGSDEQKWLDVLRSSDEPTTQDRARVRAAVLASVAGAAAASTGGAAAAGLAKSGAVVKATGAAALFSTGWKIGVAVVSLAVLGTVTATVAMRTAPTPAPSRIAVAEPTPPTAAPAPVEATPSSPADAPSVAALPPLPTEASARRGPHAPTRAAASHAQVANDDVDAELALLARAQRALERGDPSGALGDLAEHERRHPRGALALEREGLRAIASCEAKRSDGRALAERFVRAHPSAPLVGRVRAACLSP